MNVINLKELDVLSEEVEREALISLHDNCPENTRELISLHLHILDDAVIASAKNEPNVVINRTLGLGTRQAPSNDALGKIKKLYHDAGVGRFFLHVYPDSHPAFKHESLEAQGLQKTRGWMKFHRESSPLPVPETDLEVKEIDSEHALIFGKIVCESFGMSMFSIPMLAGLANDPRWHLFMSYDNGVPAGAGALFVHNDMGWLEWGATNPDFRRRGSQSAIMAARINMAHELGCKHIFTETGEAVPGDPQHSYKNILKSGFTELTLRHNYTLAAA